jgi:hypothetical protein
MGKTSFSGPVYGAKSLLWTFGPYTQTGSSGASTVLVTANAARPVPAYEDWYITEVELRTSTNSSVAAGHGVYLKSEGGSTVVPLRQDGKPSTMAQTIASIVNAAGSTTWSTLVQTTPTAGEYEGTYVPAGSSLRVLTSGVSLLGGLQVNVYGFIRFINSTRAE